MGGDAAWTAYYAQRDRDQREQEERERRMSYDQWTELGEGTGYAASGKSVGNLPPGFYDLTTIQGTIIWVPVNARTDDLIQFPDSAVDDVVVEIEKFWKAEKEFIDHGLPYKRGILLWGPPGSGKSSTLQMLAKPVIKRGGIVLMFGKTELFIAALRQLREIQPDTPMVVLMEDIDSIIEQQGESKLLNMLDGVESVHKTVFVATTNYVKRLGARIVNRPSRFDRRIKIPHPSAIDRRMYLESLIRPGDDVNIEKMIKDSEGFSIAHVKEFFTATVILKNDYDITLMILRAMIEEKVITSNDEEEFVNLTKNSPGGQYV